MRLGPRDGDHRRRARTVAPVPGRHRDHRQHGHQPAPHGRDDEHRARASDDRALRPAGAGGVGRRRARRADGRVHRHGRRAPRGVPAASQHAADRDAAARSDHRAGADDPARAARRRRCRVRHRLLERRQPDPGALGSPRGRAGRARRARREPAARCGARCSRRAWCCAGPAPFSVCCWRGRWCRSSRGMPRASRCARSKSPSTTRWCGSAWASRWPPPCSSPIVPRLPSSNAAAGFGLASGSLRITPGTNRRLRVVRDGADRVLVRAARRCGHAGRRAHRPADGEHRLPDTRQVLAFDIPSCRSGRPQHARPAIGSVLESAGPTPPPAPDCIEK